MHINYGTNLYGRSDNIPSVGYVGTEFFHVALIPLFPQQSHFVIKSAGGLKRFLKRNSEWSGYPIPSVMWKSAAFAWLRTATFLHLACRLLGVVISYSGGDRLDWAPTVIAVSIYLAAQATAWSSRCSFERAVECLRLADAPDSLALAVERAYGKTIDTTWPGRSSSLAQHPTAKAEMQVY